MAALRTLRPPPAGAPAEVAALRRALEAMLRWRLRRLPALASPHSVLAARLVPVMLHASFERPTLRAEAPGVAGLRYRRSWTTLARAFGLPPPHRAQRGPALVEAVLALPAGERVEVLVLCAAGLRAQDLAWVHERCAAAQATLAAAGGRLAVTVADPDGLARDARLGHRLVAFGALLGGQLPPAAWARLGAAARRPLEPHVVSMLASDAPTDVATLALTLLAAGPATAPLDVAARLLRRATPARALADSSSLAVRWASEVAPAQATRLARALALAGSAAVPDDPDRAAAEVEEILALGGALRLAAGRAVHRARGAALAPDDRALWEARVGAGLPRALLPALGARLRRGGPLRTTLVRTHRTSEVRLPGGVALGRGASPVQARVRALAILAAAAPDALLEHAEAPWRAVATRLAQRRDRPTLILVVEPGVPSRPPFDPLNRGPERVLGFAGALAVRAAPGRRPSARVLTSEETVERLVAEVLRCGAVEVVPARSEAHPVAARLAQLAAFLREGGHAAPRAAEAGGRVLLVEARRVRRFPLHAFLRRPRAFVPDPDSPDLALAAGERRPAAMSHRGAVECRAQLLDGRRAEVLYADGRGGHLREVVPLGELEDHLRESRAVLQAADPAALLAVRLSADLEPALRRVPRRAAPVAVSVRGDLPGPLEVELDGTWYGGATGRGWREAAAAALARWPRGDEGRLAVKWVQVFQGGKRAGGLLALWARSVALRRLRLHALLALQAYQPAGTRRSED